MSKLGFFGPTTINIHLQLGWNVSVIQLTLTRCNWKHTSILKGYNSWNGMNEAEMSIIYYDFL